MTQGGDRSSTHDRETKGIPDDAGRTAAAASARGSGEAMGLSAVSTMKGTDTIQHVPQPKQQMQTRSKKQ